MMVDISQRDLGSTVLGQDSRTTVASINRECLVAPPLTGLVSPCRPVPQEGVRHFAQFYNHLDTYQPCRGCQEGPH